MKLVAAMVATAVLTLTALLLGGPLTSSALAVPGQVPALDPQSSGPLRLDLTQMGPRVVTADGPGSLTITGTLTNTGPNPIDDLVVRVQRGDPLQTEGEVRDALDGSAGTDAVTPQFTPLADAIAPGQQVPVQLDVPLRGAPETSLALSGTGVAELLVNVNGVPRDGARARLAAVRLLLPVLSLPPSPDGTPARSTDPEEPAPGAGEPFSLLYPIADTPRRLSTVEGEPVLLTDDDLARSLAPNGRLGGLVAALASEAPPGSRVRDATCIALDPDLVQTVSLMAAGGQNGAPGYQVRLPGGATVPGTGTDVARSWLAQLTGVARGGCVLALPYADADLVALTRGGEGATASAAVTDGRQVLTNVLQTPVLPGVTWPVGGLVDEPTLNAIAGDGDSLVLSGDGIDQGRTRISTGVVPIGGARTPQTAVVADPLLSLAASGPEPDSVTAAIRGGAVATSTPAGTGTALSTQDAIGTLVFRAENAVNTGPAAAPLVLAPPHQWAAEGVGAGALLDTAGRLISAGLLSPRDLGDVLTAGAPGGAPTRALDYPLDAGGQEIPRSVVETIRTTSDQVTDLRSAVVDDSSVGIGPDELFAPLQQGLVRPASAAWRGSPDSSGKAAAAGLGRINELRNTIRVLEPPSPYSLGTSDAPLPLTVANGLPVTVRVRIEISSTSGLRVAPIEQQEIPPLGRRQVSVNAQVTRSGQFTVDAAVRTPDGGLLGPPSRLKVRSTAYGTITVWLTASAGVLLVVLVVRRVLRRIRGEPGRHAGTRRTSPEMPEPQAADPPGPPSPEPPLPTPPPTPQAGPPANVRPPPVPEDLAATDRLPLGGRPAGPSRPEPDPPRVPHQ